MPEQVLHTTRRPLVVVAAVGTEAGTNEHILGAAVMAIRLAVNKAAVVATALLGHLRQAGGGPPSGGGILTPAAVAAAAATTPATGTTASSARENNLRQPLGTLPK